MVEVGVRELKARASALVREVRERRARYMITLRGRPVAALVPLEPARLPDVESEPEAVWKELDELGEEIGRGWQAPVSSTELLSSLRR